MSDRAQFTTPRIVPMVVIGVLIIALVVEAAATNGIVPAIVGGVAGVVGGVAVIGLLVWIASHLVTFVKWPGSESDDRGQVASDPIPIVTLAIGGVVAALVGREIVATQRAALAQCAPDCQLGAPLFAHISFADAALVAIPLLGIGFLSWVVFASGVMPRRIGGERDD